METRTTKWGRGSLVSLPSTLALYSPCRIFISVLSSIITITGPRFLHFADRWRAIPSLALDRSPRHRTTTKSSIGRQAARHGPLREFHRRRIHCLDIGEAARAHQSPTGSHNDGWFQWFMRKFSVACFSPHQRRATCPAGYVCVSLLVCFLISYPQARRSPRGVRWSYFDKPLG